MSIGVPGAVLGVVGGRGVPKLMQCRAVGGLREQRLCLLVGQLGTAVLVQVGRGQRHPSPALGDEHWTGLAAADDG